MTTATTAIEVGTRVGQAIARDTIANGYDRQWTGIDAMDGDVLTAAGIEPNTSEWAAAEKAAETAYLAAVAK